MKVRACWSCNILIVNLCNNTVLFLVVLHNYQLMDGYECQKGQKEAKQIEGRNNGRFSAPNMYDMAIILTWRGAGEGRCCGRLTISLTNTIMQCLP
jgi:hypothetical protein